ncbi:MAG: hypothetical protein KBT15_06000 [Bacteroidales bacterium]|nr:hypothetical protein [Candidatus Minthousia equi]
MNKLNILKINEKSPYPIKQLSVDRYQFMTDNNVLYHLVFDEDEPIGNVPTYQFSLVNVSGSSPENDGRIKMVVVSILENFFEVNDYVILYICDTSDGRQSVRARLFTRWFQDYDKENRFYILANSLLDEDIINEFGLIFKRSNPEANSIISDYNFMINSFKNSK